MSQRRWRCVRSLFVSSAPSQANRQTRHRWCVYHLFRKDRPGGVGFGGVRGLTARHQPLFIREGRRTLVHMQWQSPLLGWEAGPRTVGAGQVTWGGWEEAVTVGHRRCESNLRCPEEKLEFCGKGEHEQNGMLFIFSLMLQTCCQLDSRPQEAARSGRGGAAKLAVLSGPTGTCKQNIPVAVMVSNVSHINTSCIFISHSVGTWPL